MEKLVPILTNVTKLQKYALSTVLTLQEVITANVMTNSTTGRTMNILANVKIKSLPGWYSPTNTTFAICL